MYEYMSQETLQINEIFSSIQGESTWSGYPCTFIRLRGCPLRCHYCDSSYAFQEGNKMTISDILKEITSSKIKLVEITGGEPLIQPNVHPLMCTLLDMGFTVLLETCGERDISVCDSRLHRIVDIKTPNSGAGNSFLASNYDDLTQKDEIKFVITDKQDYDWAVDVMSKYDLLKHVNAIHFSPVMEQYANEYILGCEGLDPQVLSQWMIDSGVQARLHFQMHKYIWPSYARKV